MTNIELDEGRILGDPVDSIVGSSLYADRGIWRLIPTWLTRLILHPGRRIKLHPGGLLQIWRGSWGHRRALVGLRYFGPKEHDHLPSAGS